MPARRGAERRPLCERVRGDEEDEAERDEQQLRQEVERGDEDPDAVERRPPDQPHERHDQDDGHRDHDVPRVPAERRNAQRAGQVVREKERRERDHDQVVEEERPAGEEAREVVQRAPDEGRRAARLRQGGGALGVGERDDQEEDADRQQHERREPERTRGDDAEREVDRRGDLAVGDGEERTGVELAAQAGKLAGH